MKSVTIVIPIFDDTETIWSSALLAAKQQSYPKIKVCAVFKEGSKYPEAIKDLERVSSITIKDRGIFTLVDMLNAAINQDTSDYITFVPQTCYLNPIKLEYQIQHLQENNKFQICASGGIAVNKRLNKIISINEKISNEFNIITGEQLSITLKKSLDKISYHYPITAGMVYDKNLFLEYGLFDNKFPLFFEIDFLFKILKTHNIQYVGNMLYTDINDELSYQNYFDITEYTNQIKIEKEMLSKVSL